MQAEVATLTLAEEIRQIAEKVANWKGARASKERSISQLAANSKNLTSLGRDVPNEIRGLRQEIAAGDDESRRGCERIAQLMEALRTVAESSTKLPLEEFLSLKIQTRRALVDFVELWKRMRALRVECPKEITTFNGLATEIEGKRLQTPRFPRVEACSFALPDWRWSQVRAGDIEAALTSLIADLA